MHIHSLPSNISINKGVKSDYLNLQIQASRHCMVLDPESCVISQDPEDFALFGNKSSKCLDTMLDTCIRVGFSTCFSPWHMDLLFVTFTSFAKLDTKRFQGG